MPRISYFYGIAIYMYWTEHGFPHVHARHAEFEFVVNVLDGEILEGDAPRQKLKMVQGWVELHRAELLENWQRCRNHIKPIPVAPLD